MGSPTSEKCRDKDETQHQVTLSHSYEIMTTEVVRGNFESLMGYDPLDWGRTVETYAVGSVTWHEAIAYCNTLSAIAGYPACFQCSGIQHETKCKEETGYSDSDIYKCEGYRLPTEAEWEHAYRAGTTTALYNGGITNCSGIDPNAVKIGWYLWDPYNSYPRMVGQKEPNTWGLYDMAGSVWEWCHDWYQDDLGSSAMTDPWGAMSGKYRVRRGGSSSERTRAMRAANRSGHYPSWGFSDIGFRCARTIK